MKLQVFIIVQIIGIIAGKTVETETEEFECIANYLRDKKLLDKSFKYFVQSQPLECDTYIAEISESWINKTLKAAFEDGSTSDEGDEDETEDKELIEFKKLYARDPGCVHDQLRALNYSDILMQIFVYRKSRQLSSRQKKKFLASLEDDTVKKLMIASTICFPDPFFGLMFDEIFAEEESKPLTREDKEVEHCITKYVIENGLVDASQLNLIDATPQNADFDGLDCAGHIEDLFEDLEEHIKEQIVSEKSQSRRQIRCMTGVIREKKAAQYLAKLSVLADVSLSESQKSEMREEFVKFMTGLYVELVKCF